MEVEKLQRIDILQSLLYNTYKALSSRYIRLSQQIALNNFMKELNITLC